MKLLLFDTVRSIKLYAELWFRSFTQNSESIAALSSQRILFLLIIFPLFLIVQAIHILTAFLDEIFFSDYHNQPVEAPVFITGIPRSGTTFIHRALNKNSAYTSFSTWEAILAPGVLERKILRGLSAVDRSLGAPVRKTVDFFLRQLTGDFNDIHALDLWDAEEDYLALLPYGACFLLFLAFPFSSQLLNTARLDKMPDRDRNRLLHHYHRLLQKHLYTAAKNRTLLSKNAAFASWIPYLKDRYPDAKFIVCIREPSAALTSQLSSIRPAESILGSRLSGPETATIFIELFEHNYRFLERELRQCRSTQRLLLVEQRLLKKNSASILAKTADYLDSPDSPEFDHYLQTLPQENDSAHIYRSSGLHGMEALIQNRIVPYYEQLIKLDCLIK